MTEIDDMAGRKKPDPLDTLAVGVAADHAANKAAEEAKGEALDAGSTTEEANALSTVVGEKVAEATGNGDASADAPGSAADTVSSDASADSGPAAPAPGDDAGAVFDRRLDRLTTLVEQAEFESGTALGDLIELIVDLFRHRPKLWSAMPTDEQKTLVKHVETVAKQALRKVVLVVAEEGSDTIQGTFLGNFSVKGETIEAKLKIEGVDQEVLMAAYKLSGHKIVLVSADDKRFSSKRREPEIMPDQLGMQFAGDVREAPREIKSDPPAASHPANDSDLADGADDEEEDDETGGDEAPGLAVYDPEAEVWLAASGTEDDPWTDKPEEAALYTRADAENAASGYAEGLQIVEHPAPPAAPQADG